MKIFKCSICGNVVELLNKGGGTLVCCGKDMIELPVNNEETTFEKHIPVIEKEGNKVKVKVGEVTHPMLKEHYIEWIALVEDDFVQKKILRPEEEPVAEFSVKSDKFTVYAYCNIHGFYKKESK